MLTVSLITFLLALLPISELRGAIPYGLSQGLPLWLTLALALTANLLVAPLAYFFLDYLHALFLRVKVYRYFSQKILEKSRYKVYAAVERYGFYGLILFVGVPLPITGAWSATLGAWLLGLSRKKTLLAVSLGLFVSASLVTALTLFGIKIFHG